MVLAATTIWLLSPQGVRRSRPSRARADEMARQAGPASELHDGSPPEPLAALSTRRYPCVVAFAFGLLQGLGFADALEEIGLHEGDVPLALLTFNLGVEAGQQLFIAMILVSGWQLRRLDPQLVDRRRRPRSAGAVAVAYAIGGVSAYWLIERVAAF